MSFDNLYNNFKIVKQEVKVTSNSSLSSSSQNMAFVSSPRSTNELNTAYEVSTVNTQVSPASTQVSIASTQVSTANLSDATVYAFLANQPNGSQLVHEDLEQIYEDNLEEMDLKWQLALLSMKTIRGARNQDTKNRNQDNSRRTVNMEDTSFKATMAIDGAGFVTYNAVPPPTTLVNNTGRCAPPTVDLSYSGLVELKKPEFEGYRPKSIEEQVSDDLEKKTVSPTASKVEFVKTKEQIKPVRKTVRYAKMYRSKGPRGDQRN
ncbi:hypothetical protein Tco_1035850 [Tanacetum coccineum]